MSIRGWVIGLSIAAGVIYGGVTGITYAQKHTEANDDCYTMANNNAHDPRVQLAMSDGFLSAYECNEYVYPADDARQHREKFDLFMNAVKT